MEPLPFLCHLSLVLQNAKRCKDCGITEMRFEIIYTEEFPLSPRTVINIDGVFKAANHTNI